MSKLKYKACKNIKEFNKICRKYTKKFFGLRGKGKYNYSHHWYTWVWVDIVGEQPLFDDEITNYANRLAKKGHTNLQHILKTVRENYGWSYVETLDNLTYYLRGIQISNEDYYYVYVNDYGKRRYSSCVGHFNDVDTRHNSVRLYEKSTGDSILIPKCTVEMYKELMIEKGMDMDNYEFQKIE